MKPKPVGSGDTEVTRAASLRCPYEGIGWNTNFRTQNAIVGAIAQLTAD